MIYPQGEGTPEQAQALINQFAAYLTKETARPWSGQYINDAKAGENLIRTAPKSEAPLQWILTTSSFVSMSTNPLVNALTPSLKTKRIFAKSDKDVYFILKKENASALKKIYYEASLPSVLAKKLTSSLNTQAALVSVPLIFPQIKKLSQERKTDEGILLNESLAIILTEIMKPDWAKGLALSEALGSIEYPGVYWVNSANEELKSKTLQSLENMPSDSKGKKILEELRIDSFIK